MRRASSLFLRALSKSKPKPNPTLPLPKFLSPQSQSQSHLHRRPFATDNAAPRRQPNPQALEDAFESAKTTEDILSTFAALEPSLPSNTKTLAVACLKVGQHLDSLPDDHPKRDPEKVFELALRAVVALDANKDAAGSITLAMALQLAASACYDLKRFTDCFGFSNRASRILDALEAGGSEEFDIRPVSHAVQLLLANVKTAVGRREEALENLRRCLDIKISILEPDSRELGVGYRDLAEAYATLLNFNEALPLCLKALAIHEGCLGQNSVEVAHDRRLLGVIYTGLDRQEKALEQNRLSRSVMKSWGMGSDLLHAEIDAANIQIAMGKFDEAIKTLQGVVEQTDSNSETRALVYISLAKAMCNQEKPSDAKQCLEVCRGILEKKELESPVTVAEAYVEISMLYETMNEFETAISLLKRSLSIIERIPQEQHIEGTVSAKIGWLLLLTGKVSEAIPYLESAAERMKESFGPKHFGVGYIYNNLGAAYMELERPHSAAQMFTMAKEIMDVSLGPHHTDSIETLQSTANVYSKIGSYPLALEFQQQVVNAWENHGPSAKDQLKEAIRLLDQIKKKAFESLSKSVTQEALPEAK